MPGSRLIAVDHESYYLESMLSNFINDIFIPDDDLPDGWRDFNNNAVKDIFEYEDRDLDGQVDAGSWNGGAGPGETDPNAPDTDSDNITDKGELTGWPVKIYWTRNPLDNNSLPAWYDVTSDPLDSDTEDDGVQDGAERAENADPTKSDSDGDSFLDGDEASMNSTLSGIESGIPTMSKDIDTSTSWNDRYWHGVWVGKKLVTNIDVDIQGYDVAGVKDIRVKVFSSNKLHGKEKEVTKVGDQFQYKFKFDFKLDSLVTEIWSGWHVYIQLNDINCNYGFQDEHIKSGIQALIDWAAEALKDLMDAILNWLWERVKAIIDFALKPVKDAIDGWQSGLIRALEKTETELNENDEVSQDTADELMSYLYGSLYFTISAIVIVLMSALLLVEIITAGALTALSTATGLIIGLILGLVGATAITLDLDWSFGINPISSARDTAIEWYGNKASEQDISITTFGWICDMFAAFFGGAAIAAGADPTGLVPVGIAVVSSVMASILGFISYTYPMVWLIGLFFCFLSLGFGAWATLRVTGTARNLGIVAGAIGSVGLSVNLANLGGFI